MEITLAQMDFHTTQNGEECKSKHQTNDVISTPRNEVMISGWKLDTCNIRHRAIIQTACEGKRKQQIYFMCQHSSF